MCVLSEGKEFASLIWSSQVERIDWGSEERSNTRMKQRSESRLSYSEQSVVLIRVVDMIFFVGGGGLIRFIPKSKGLGLGPEMNYLSLGTSYS